MKALLSFLFFSFFLQISFAQTEYISQVNDSIRMEYKLSSVRNQDTVYERKMYKHNILVEHLYLKNNQMVGRYYSYYDNGDRLMEGFYDQKGKASGTWRRYHQGAKTLRNLPRYRAILRDDPATTITIGWDQLSGKNPIIFYGTLDKGEDIDAYPHKIYPQRSIKAKGMNNHFARLSKLKPNTVYYFVIADSEGKSRRFSFRTLPDDHKAKLSIIAGGDSRNLKTARLNANKIVARLRPHFVMFSGDMTGGDSDKEWVEWMNDWQYASQSHSRRKAPEQ